MSKRFSKFNLSMQEEFPFLKKLENSDSQVFCTLCDGRFDTGDGGRARIKIHLRTKKHIRSLSAINTNQPMSVNLSGNSATGQSQWSVNDSMTQRDAFNETAEESSSFDDHRMERFAERFDVPDDHVSKCRCCFRTMEDDEKFVKISDRVQKKFFELTQLKLIQAEGYSKFICSLCENDLDVFSNFRFNLIAKQKKLYNFVKTPKPAPQEPEPVVPKIAIKKEIEDSSYEDDFIDCSSYVDSVEVKVETSELRQVMRTKRMIKSEVHEINHQISNEAVDFSQLLTSSKPMKVRTNQQCQICGANVKSMRHHISKAHLTLKNFFCDVCGHGTYYKSDIESHMKSHVKKIRMKCFCDICGLELATKTSLSAHVRTEHLKKERIHQCTICDKTFYTTESLRKHIDAHSIKERPCEYCGKLFTTKANLRKHLYYHSEPRFVCKFPDCDKKFYMRNRFMTHLKTHDGKKDFQCEFCEKGYFTQDDLNRHLFSIHQKMRFLCEIPGCNGDFSRRAYYKKHALAHHQNLCQEEMEELLQKVKDAIPVHKL